MPSIEHALEGPPQIELASEPPPRRDRHGRTRKHAPGKRLDIQGLRAVAVVAVVVNHLTNHPVGGFVGVDVFFVISGYLMTSILLRELGRSHSVGGYIGWFYARRFRRLVPAALVVTGLTVLFAGLVLNGVRTDQARTDAGWATIFAANWRMISVGTNYFSEGAPPSPFQHYWSLSVEEQFYLVWPFVLLLVAGGAVLLFRASGERAARVRGIAGLAVSLLVVAGSLWFAAGQSTSDPVRAYFSTFTRLWELALGGVVTIVIRFVRVGPVWLTVMSWTGLAVIGVSLFTVHGGSGFPVPGAIAPCLGSALVLLAASPSDRARNFLLTNRASALLGDISYSVYLVHFPAIILLSAYMPHSGWWRYAAIVGVTLGLSCMLYGLVEQPVLRSDFLRPRTARGQRDSAADDTVSPWHVAVAGGLAVAIAGCVVAVWPGNQAAINQKYAQINQAAPTSPTTTVPPLQAKLTGRIQAALAVTSWPKLTPTVDAVVSGREAPPDIGACARLTVAPAAQCTWGSPTAKHTMIVVGDSTSMVYTVGLRAAFKNADWKVRLVGAVGCNFTSIVMQNADHALQAGCPAHNGEAVAAIKQAHPDLVVISNTYQARTPVGQTKPLTDAQWAATLQAEIVKIKPYVGKVVLMSPAPYRDSLGDCYRPSGNPVDCVASISKPWKTRSVTELALAQQMSMGYLDTRAWYCAPNGFCPPFVDTTPVMHDGSHPSIAYMQKIAPVMREAFDVAKFTS